MVFSTILGCSTTQSWIKGTNRYDNRPWEAKVKKVSTRFDSPRISERSLASRSRQLEWNGKNATICRVGIITNCIITTFFWHCYKMCNAIVIPAGTAPSLWVSSFLCILIISHHLSYFWSKPLLAQDWSLQLKFMAADHLKLPAACRHWQYKRGELIVSWSCSESVQNMHFSTADFKTSSWLLKSVDKERHDAHHGKDIR